ncbi:hypothetical protein T03_11279 [Trichinella britovi]|uniref:Uncharacterized protein n=1 Tax=Trichinella britovi TaxID=45882 RepID=A0A0V1D3S7_TRIBR|nr:hypothetical protein T03_11279 [Trichinella britovi]
MPLLLHLLTTWINRNQNFSELTTSCTVLMQHDICGSSAMKMQIYKMPRKDLKKFNEYILNYLYQL